MTSDTITRRTMWDVLLAEEPGFAPKRAAFVSDWQSEGEPLPEFICIGDLVAYTLNAFERGDSASVERVISVVARWYREGDEDVQELATTGFLEDFGNGARHKASSPDELRGFLPSDLLADFDSIRDAWAAHDARLRATDTDG
ncbi:MAG: hypothetical protein HKN27_03215 [Silicimonas sp.]|nr:hypothetical protein [Silicimonas sp.]